MATFILRNMVKKKTLELFFCRGFARTKIYGNRQKDWDSQPKQRYFIFLATFLNNLGEIFKGNMMTVAVAFFSKVGKWR